MTIEELIRQKTHEIRYALEGFKSQQLETAQKRKADDERLKRASTEITRHRAIENERKRSLRDAEDKLSESRQMYEEIERQRQEALSRLTEREEEKENLKQFLQEAERATKRAEAQVGDVKKSQDQYEAEIKRLEDDIQKHNKLLTEAFLIALDTFLHDAEERISRAFDGEVERQKKAAATAAFQKARHEDTTISDLYEQLIQLRDMKGMATVPGVKQRLALSIQEIENELEQIYPGALSAERTLQEARLVEDLQYYVANDDKVSFLFPVQVETWRKVEQGERNLATSRAMRLLWDFLGKDIENGSFEMCRNWVSFRSECDREDIPVLNGFKLHLTPISVLDFQFSPLPIEIQESL